MNTTHHFLSISKYLVTYSCDWQFGKWQLHKSIRLSYRSIPVLVLWTQTQYSTTVFSRVSNPWPLCLLLHPICITYRAGNSLIGFLSKSLVFCEKMSKWAIRSKKRAIRSVAQFWWGTWAIRSWLLIFGEQPERIAHIAHFCWATWAIRSHCSFLVSNLSNSLTSLIKKAGMSKSLNFK